MSKQYSTADLARHLGISRSQVYRDLQSFPHRGAGTLDITFTEDNVAEIEQILNAGPDEQLARLLLLDTKRALLQAQDDFDDMFDVAA